jgi:hypothetical protein
MRRLLLLLVLIGCLAYPTAGRAGVHIGLGINLFLPPVVFQAPPPVVVVPVQPYVEQPYVQQPYAGQPYVYYVPGAQVDIFFYNGYWWRPYQGHWYRSSHYNSGWAYVEPRRVPRAFYHLPPDYRYRRYPERISHNELNQNWSRWEKERHWDSHQQRGPNQNYQGNNQQYHQGPNQNYQGHYDQYNYHPNQNRQ